MPSDGNRTKRTLLALNGVDRLRTPGRAPLPQAVVQGGFEIYVPAERHRISERQNLCRAETAEAVLAIDPVEEIRQSGLASAPAGRPVGASSSMTMNVRLRLTACHSVRRDASQLRKKFDAGKELSGVRISGEVCLSR
jgi:hypothetical protein